MSALACSNLSGFCGLHLCKHVMCDRKKGPSLCARQGVLVYETDEGTQCTFHSDDVHAFDCIQRAEACIDGTVADFALVPAGHHHSACSTPSLATAQLRPSQPKPCNSILPHQLYTLVFQQELGRSTEDVPLGMCLDTITHRFATALKGNCSRNARNEMRL